MRRSLYALALAGAFTAGTAALAAAPTADDVAGAWLIGEGSTGKGSSGKGARTCLLGLALEPSGKNFVLDRGSGCDRFPALADAVSWDMEDGELVIRDGKGEITVRLTAEGEESFRAADGSEFVMRRQMGNSDAAVPVRGSKLAAVLPKEPYVEDDPKAKDEVADDAAAKGDETAARAADDEADKPKVDDRPLRGTWKFVRDNGKAICVVTLGERKVRGKPQRFRVSFARGCDRKIARLGLNGWYESGDKLVFASRRRSLTFVRAEDGRFAKAETEGGDPLFLERK